MTHRGFKFFRKAASIVLTCIPLLAGCGREAADQTVSRTGFATGASREEIVEQLTKLTARILSEANDEILAEFQDEGMTKAMRARLVFEDGKLKSISYIPQ